jgi:hypothetical protein
MPTNATQRTIDHQLSFLRTDLGYALIRSEVNAEYNGANLLVYRSEMAAKQLEISADDGYFHCEIRRIIAGRPAAYEDLKNSIGFESLAVLESNGNYEHMDYFAGGSHGLNGVLKTSAALFRRHSAWLAGDAWIDLERLRTLRPYLVNDGPSVFDQLVSAVKLALDPMGCSITWHNKLLSSYHKDRYPDRVILKAAGHQVEIKQNDWRDDYMRYTVRVDGTAVHSIDYTDRLPHDERAQRTIAAVLKTLEGLG